MPESILMTYPFEFTSDSLFISPDLESYFLLLGYDLIESDRFVRFLFKIFFELGLYEFK